MSGATRNQTLEPVDSTSKLFSSAKVRESSNVVKVKDFNTIATPASRNIKVKQDNFGGSSL